MPDDEPSRADPGPVLDVAKIARIYSALEGGIYANQAEREIAAEIERAAPGTMRLVRATRRFHARAALWAVTETPAAGVVFTAAGYPADPALHADALAAVPSARFAYVSADPDVTRFRKAVQDAPQVTAVTGSSREPERLMALAEVRRVGAPVSVQVQLAAHFWDSALAADLIARWARLLPSGSSIVPSLAVAGTATGNPPWPYAASVMGAMHAHAPQDVERWLEEAGLRIAGPGVQDVRAWPGEEWAGHGRRPGGTIAEAVAVKP